MYLPKCSSLSGFIRGDSSTLCKFLLCQHNSHPFYWVQYEGSSKTSLISLFAFWRSSDTSSVPHICSMVVSITNFHLFIFIIPKRTELNFVKFHTHIYILRSNFCGCWKVYFLNSLYLKLRSAYVISRRIQNYVFIRWYKIEREAF